MRFAGSFLLASSYLKVEFNRTVARTRWIVFSSWGAVCQHRVSFLAEAAKPEFSTVGTVALCLTLVFPFGRPWSNRRKAFLRQGCCGSGGPGLLQAPRVYWSETRSWCCFLQRPNQPSILSWSHSNCLAKESCLSKELPELRVVRSMKLELPSTSPDHPRILVVQEKLANHCGVLFDV